MATKTAKKTAKTAKKKVAGSVYTKKEIDKQNEVVLRCLHEGKSIASATKEAGIGVQTFYDRQKADSSFNEKVVAMQNTMRMLGENSLFIAMQRENNNAHKSGENLTITRWYLERRIKEYQNRQEISGEFRAIPFTPEQAKRWISKKRKPATSTSRKK